MAPVAESNDAPGSSRRPTQIEKGGDHHGTVKWKGVFANFSSYDASFQTKARLALANSWKKLRTGSGCCGQYGQPGC